MAVGGQTVVAVLESDLKDDQPKLYSHVEREAFASVLLSLAPGEIWIRAGRNDKLLSMECYKFLVRHKV